MADIFDKHADNYSESINRSLEKFGAKHDFFASHKAQLLMRLLKRHGLQAVNCRFLDVGCGTGMMHSYINGQFATIDGIDSSQESVRVAAENNPANCYRSYSGGQLPYDDGTFDVAFAAAVFHHVAPIDRPLLAQGILRVLRRGGLAIIVEHNPFNPVTRHIVNTCELDKDAILLRPAELRKLFSSAGAQSGYTRTVLRVSSTRRPILSFGASAALRAGYRVGPGTQHVGPHVARYAETIVPAPGS
jgi:SAM-dependent methyltransferase